MKNNFKKAFSLIEISIVILVVGLLIAGISRGLDMAYDSARLASARALTDKAPVGGIENLELWLETTSQNSLATGIASFTNVKNPEDRQQIGRWNDINPTLTDLSKKNNALQATLDFQPRYIRNGINGLPALLFDGSNDFFSYNGDFLIGSDYTIFVVEARTRGGNDNFFLAGSQGVEGNNLLLGYWLNQDITHSHWGGNRVDNVAISAYSFPVPRVHSFAFGKKFGKESYTNGIQKISDSLQKNPLASYPNSSIGKAYTSSYYKGYIGEIIVYSKDLNDNDRKLIETYLIEKWRIKL
jgi:prepilin-type N-terminal cleavage/methylation domain-containing protein